VGDMFTMAQGPLPAEMAITPRSRVEVVALRRGRGPGVPPRIWIFTRGLVQGGCAGPAGAGMGQDVGGETCKS
jgi:hypothetical protein